MTSVGGNGLGLDCQYRLMSFRSTVYRRSAIITSLMTHSGKVRLFFSWVVCLFGCVRRPLPGCKSTSLLSALTPGGRTVDAGGLSIRPSYLAHLSETRSSPGKSPKSRLKVTVGIELSAAPSACLSAPGPEFPINGLIVNCYVLRILAG